LKREIGDIDGIAFTLQMLSQFAFSEGDYPQAIEWLEESLRCFREVGNRHFTVADLFTRATIYWALGDYPQAVRSVDETLAVSRDTDDHRRYLMSLLRKGDILLSSGDVAGAEKAFKEALQNAQEIQDQGMKEAASIGIGEIDFLAGKMDRAQEHWQAAKQIGEETHNWPLAHKALLWQGKVALWQGNSQLAAKLIGESLNYRIKMEDRVNLAYLLEFVASVAIQQTKFEKAARLFGAADRHFNLLKNTLIPVERQRREQDLANLQEKLGNDLFHQYFLDGVNLTNKQINQLLRSD
jgi:tetratricopeptide (TPR) repeat protein